MKMFRQCVLAGMASLLMAGVAVAQPGPGMGGGGMGGGGMGPGMMQSDRPCMKADGTAKTDMGPNCGWRMNRRNTPGMGLMTPEERRAHRDKMRSMKTAEECQAYMTEHHAQMAERAKAKGITLPAPRSNACMRFGTPAVPAAAPAK